jgi:hypothetical protein
MLPPVPVMTQTFPDNLGDIDYTPTSEVTFGTSAKYQ